MAHKTQKQRNIKTSSASGSSRLRKHRNESRINGIFSNGYLSHSPGRAGRASKTVRSQAEPGNEYYGLLRVRGASRDVGCRVKRPLGYRSQNRAEGGLSATLRLADDLPA